MATVAEGKEKGANKCEVPTSSMKKEIQEAQEEATNSTSGATSHTPAPTHSLRDSEGAELGSQAPGKGTDQGVQRSPPVGDTAEVSVKVELATGQMPSAPAAAEPNSHSSVPIPVVTADAGSRSHSPVPIPVASAIETTATSIASDSTSNNQPTLKQGTGEKFKKNLHHKPLNFVCRRGAGSLCDHTPPD